MRRNLLLWTAVILFKQNKFTIDTPYQKIASSPNVTRIDEINE